MTLAEAIQAYEEDREKHGVAMPGGVCISESHVGHNHD